MPRLTEEDIEDLISDTKTLDKVLTAAKIRKDVGVGDQAEIDAIRSKVELEKTLGNLFVRESVLEAIVQEHIAWGKEVDDITALTLGELEKSKSANATFTIGQKEAIKFATEAAIREVRRKMSIGRKNIDIRTKELEEEAALSASLEAELDKLADKPVKKKSGPKSTNRHYGARKR